MKKKRLAYVRIFVKIETGYHWKKYSYSKHSSPNKNKVINNKTANE